MKTTAKTLLLLVLTPLGMWLLDVPASGDALTRWVWHPLGVAVLLLAGGLLRDFLRGAK